MKNVKGFTLIEIMIVMAIIGILASVFIPMIMGKEGKWPKQSRTNVTAENYYKAEDVKRGYIDNDKRSSDVVTLKRHSDGQLYACDSTGDDCKRVEE